MPVSLPYILTLPNLNYIFSTASNSQHLLTHTLKRLTLFGDVSNEERITRQPHYLNVLVFETEQRNRLCLRSCFHCVFIAGKHSLHTTMLIAKCLQKEENVCFTVFLGRRPSHIHWEVIYSILK